MITNANNSRLTIWRSLPLIDLMRIPFVPGAPRAKDKRHAIELINDEHELRVFHDLSGRGATSSTLNVDFSCSPSNRYLRRFETRLARRCPFTWQRLVMRSERGMPVFYEDVSLYLLNLRKQLLQDRDAGICPDLWDIDRAFVAWEPDIGLDGYLLRAHCPNARFLKKAAPARPGL